MIDLDDLIAEARQAILTMDYTLAYQGGLVGRLADALEAAARAAQGAAPQAEAYVHCCNHPKCPGGSLCCCASEQRLRDCWNQWLLEIAGDTKQAFRDGYQAGQNDPAPWLAAPVLPSSDVDEDALAEVIAKSRGFGNGWEQIPPLTRGAYREIARAVAELLKEQSR